MSRRKFRQVGEGEPVVPGFSFSNGNCIEVTYIAGFYYIRDTKLGKDSPVWILTSEQFHTLGRELSFQFVRTVRNSLEIRLGTFCTFSSVRIPKLDRTGLDPHSSYRWQLCSYPHTLTFGHTEIIEFCWGYMFGQFPENAPPLELIYAEPRQFKSV